MDCPHLAGKDLLGPAKCQNLHNGVQMPLIGLGTWRLRGDKLRSGVFGALHEGYGLIDSAAVYGNEEEIRELLKEAGSPRVFLTSKLQPRDANGREAVLRAFEATVKRLNVEQLDLYLIHWPGKLARHSSLTGSFYASARAPEEHSLVKNSERIVPSNERKRTSHTPTKALQIYTRVVHAGTSGVAVDSEKNRRLRLESWQALEKLYEEKKEAFSMLYKQHKRTPAGLQQVRAIGVSNFLISHLEDLLADGAKVMPMVNQLEWHPMCWIPEMIPFAERHNMKLQAYSSLGSGEDRLLEHPVVKEIAKEINQPPAVVLLRWPIQQGLMVIPCSTSREHLRENAAALNCQLTEDQMNRLCSIKDNTQHRFCWDPNTIS